MQIDQEFLSNPIRSYLYILVILIGTFIFKRFISRFFASLIYTWVDKKNHSDLRKSHVHRLVVPIEQFLLFLVAVVALYELKFPILWDVHLFKVSLQQAIDSTVKLLFIILLIRVFIRTLEFVAIILEEKSKLTKSLSDDQLVLFFRDFFKVILYIIGALFIISSFIIFFDKPFSIGDLVKVNNFTGTIEKIGLRSTRIRTQDKTYITVPNKQMVDTIVDNISCRTERKIEMDLQISVITSAEALTNFVSFMRSEIEKHPPIISSSVFLSDAGKQFHTIHIECFISIATDLNVFQQLRETLNLKAVAYANAHQISFSEKV